MTEQIQDRTEDTVGGLTFTHSGIKGWINVRWSVSYRKVLWLGIIVLTIVTGANLPSVLELVSNLMAVAGL
jgi:hypothetical protein